MKPSLTLRVFKWLVGLGSLALLVRNATEIRELGGGWWLPFLVFINVLLSYVHGAADHDPNWGKDENRPT